MVKFIRFLFVCAVILAVAGCGLVGITIWYFGRDLPDYSQLAHYQPPIMTRVQAGDGRLLAEYAAERRVFVPIQAIPKRVIDAFVSAEDKNFYNHHGVDPLSVIRAAITDVGRLHSNRRPVGASTITQQVAKNMLLSSEVSLARKIKEVLLATRIEAAMPKERILELYLNEIYLGSGAYGVAAAAQTYFDKSLDDLTLGEAAFLGGLPKAPNRYNPAHFMDTATARRDWVLDRMVEDGFASRPMAEAAEAEAIILHRRREADQVKAPYFAEQVRRELIARYGEKVLYSGGLSVRTSLDPRLQTAADKALRDGLIAYDHAHEGWRGGIARIDPKGDWVAHLAAVPVPAVANDVGWRLAVVLRTTPGDAAIGFVDGDTGHIPFSQMRWARPRYSGGGRGPAPRGTGDVVKPGDVVMAAPIAASPQDGSEGAEARADDKRDGQNRWAAERGQTKTRQAATTPPDPTAFTLCQVPEVSGALVVMDPHSGRVLAISGGFSFAISQFDRATQAYRQTGSAIKPFVFLTALENGFTPSTRVSDAPISLPQGPGLPMWTPTNYEADRFRGPTPLRIGLEQSIDTLTVRLATMIGLDPIAQTIERFGILDHVPHEYAITLGAGATTPLRLTTAYSMIVNGGKRITPTVIDRVQDRNGKTIWRADDRPCDGCGDVDWQHQPVPVMPDSREQVADPGSAYQMVTMMQGVVERGTGTAVKAVDKPLAGKTGTTNDFRDAWFVGFSPDLAAGVYVGYDEPDSLGKDETGGHVAAPIFRDLMFAALKNTPAVDFRIPPGLRLYRVSAATGLPVSGSEPAIYEAYKPGTEPGSSPKRQSKAGAEEDSPDAAGESGPGDPQSNDMAAGTREPDQMGSADAEPPRGIDAAPSGDQPVASRLESPPPASNRGPPPSRGAPASGTGGLY
ncbi:MAG: PBP1A family penicillin-binding protein [Alphaproteobacteria bacterium]|nr:PBP1A family penicillin-binding protein [Alphaproteobacteria bacterium]